MGRGASGRAVPQPCRPAPSSGLTVRVVEEDLLRRHAEQNQLPDRDLQWCEVAVDFNCELVDDLHVLIDGLVTSLLARAVIEALLVVLVMVIAVFGRSRTVPSRSTAGRGR